jgi:hypothetical protein
MSPPDVQLTKGHVLDAMRLAVLDVFGPAGLADVAPRLSADTRAQTLDAPASTLAWLPERFLVEWNHAVFEGPAKRDDAVFCRVIDRRVDLGFGRVRRTLLGLLGPADVARRGVDLWRRDHTHGTMRLEVDVAARAAQGTVSDHLFCDDPLSGRALAEALRHILQLSRGVRAARETHGPQGKALFIRVAWQ